MPPKAKTVAGILAVPAPCGAAAGVEKAAPDGFAPNVKPEAAPDVAAAPLELGPPNAKGATLPVDDGTEDVAPNPRAGPAPLDPDGAAVVPNGAVPNAKAEPDPLDAGVPPKRKGADGAVTLAAPGALCTDCSGASAVLCWAPKENTLLPAGFDEDSIDAIDWPNVNGTAVEARLSQGALDEAPTDVGSGLPPDDPGTAPPPSNVEKVEPDPPPNELEAGFNDAPSESVAGMAPAEKTDAVPEEGADENMLPPVVPEPPNEKATAPPVVAPKVKGAGVPTVLDALKEKMGGGAAFVVAALADEVAPDEATVAAPAEDDATNWSSSSSSLFPDASRPTSIFLSGHTNLVGTPALAARAFFCSSRSFAFCCSVPERLFAPAVSDAEGSAATDADPVAKEFTPIDPVDSTPLAGAAVPNEKAGCAGSGADEPKVKVLVDGWPEEPLDTAEPNL